MALEGPWRQPKDAWGDWVAPMGQGQPGKRGWPQPSCWGCPRASPGHPPMPPPRPLHLEVSSLMTNGALRECACGSRALSVLWLRRKPNSQEPSQAHTTTPQPKWSFEPTTPHAKSSPLLERIGTTMSPLPGPSMAYSPPLWAGGALDPPWGAQDMALCHSSAHTPGHRTQQDVRVCVVFLAPRPGDTLFRD